MIYAVINQKGGAGKTTLAVHLALHLADTGRRVAFVDNDPQQSATRWVSAAEPGMTLDSLTTADALVERLQTLSATHDDVVCDGSPRLNDQTHVLMYFADRILIPVLPSALDVQATIETKQAIDRVALAKADDGLAGPDVLIALNKVRAMGEQAKLVRKVLRDMGLPIARQAVGLRDAFSKAVVDDTVVSRVAGKNKGNAQAAADLARLFEQVVETTAPAVETADLTAPAEPAPLARAA
jgi:chromosome partitioning protein